MSDASSDFNILEVAPDASFDEVRRAYRDAVRVWHPDRFGTDDRLRKRAEQKIRNINQAYARLEALYATTNETKRADKSDNPIPKYQDQQAGNFGMAPAPKHDPIWRRPIKPFAAEVRAAWLRPLMIATSAAVLTIALGVVVVQFIAVHADRSSRLSSQPVTVAAAGAPIDELTRIVSSLGATFRTVPAARPESIQEGLRPGGATTALNILDNMGRPAIQKTPLRFGPTPGISKVSRPENGMELAHWDNDRGYGTVHVMNKRDEDIAFEIATSGSNRLRDPVVRAIYVRRGEEAEITDLSVGLYRASVISGVTVETRSGCVVYNGMKHLLPGILSFSQVESSREIESLRYSITVPQRLP